MSDFEDHATGLFGVIFWPTITGLAAVAIKHLWSKDQIIFSLGLFVICILWLGVYGAYAFSETDKSHNNPYYYEHDRKTEIFKWWARIGIVFAASTYSLMMVFG